MRRILLINPFGIGDVLFTTGLLDAVRSAWPDAYIGYWCSERSAELFLNDSRVNRVFPLSRGDIKRLFSVSRRQAIGRVIALFADIRRSRFEAALDFSLDGRYAAFSMLAGIPFRSGFNYRQRGRFLNEQINIAGYNKRHVIEYYFDILGSLGIKAAPAAPRLILSESERVNAGNILQAAGIDLSKPLVGIAPAGGASWGRDAVSKQWPVDNFAGLAVRITRELGAQVVLFGEPGEQEISKAVAVSSGCVKADLTGKTSLREFACLVSRMDLLVANDGGPLHIGIAAGTKTVSIFGPVDEKVYGPYPLKEGRNAVVSLTFACRPCYRDFKFAPLNGCGRDCLRKIEAGRVFEDVKKLLVGNL